MISVAIDSKFFGPTHILGQVHFTAKAGDIVALLAPSGTGKTTVLRIVLGLDTGFSGTVNRPGGSVGAVFQEPRLLPWLNIAANLRLAAPDLTDESIEAMLTDLDLAGITRLMPKQISLGMARRVSLARALAVQPALLVLDEPFASLDARLAAELAAAVASRARAMGTTVIMATHDLDQALVVAHRVLVLAGRPAALVRDAAVPTHGKADFAAELRSVFRFLDATG
jgi:NitT/TauT family transport system ATP-binding protein